MIPRRGYRREPSALTAIVGRLAGRPGVERFGRVAVQVTILAFFLSVLSLWFDGAAVKETITAEGVTAFTRHWIRLLSVAVAGTLAALWVWRRLRRPAPR